jgi:2-iminobutanoate/2-iminopropanoate deaminase
MPKQAVSAAAAPKAIGPYSQAVAVAPGRLLFLSGQTPIDPATGRLVEGRVADQTRRCLDNLAAVLAAAGADPSRIVKTTVFLRDMADFKAMNEAYAAYFPAEPPARSTVAVAGLPLDARVEIEAVAALD